MLQPEKYSANRMDTFLLWAAILHMTCWPLQNLVHFRIAISWSFTKFDRGCHILATFAANSFHQQSTRYAWRYKLENMLQSCYKDVLTVC